MLKICGGVVLKIWNNEKPCEILLLRFWRKKNSRGLESTSWIETYRFNPKEQNF